MFLHWLWKMVRNIEVFVKLTDHLCGSPPEVPHSRIRFGNIGLPLSDINQLSESEVVYYECLSGYSLKDEEEHELICKNGEWQGNLPSCSEFCVFI